MIEHEFVKQSVESSPCQEAGCTLDGFACYLPDYDSTNEPYFYCSEHAFNNGFCKMCGSFNGGLESFEFIAAETMMSTTTEFVRIDLAVNEPQNGGPSGRCYGINVEVLSDTALSLDPVTGDTGPVCRIDDQRMRVKLSHVWYPIRRHSRWVGNWCWDSVDLEPATAARLLNDARASKWWSLDAGFDSWWERWESGDPFTAQFLLADASAGPQGPGDPELVGDGRHSIFG